MMPAQTLERIAALMGHRVRADGLPRYAEGLRETAQALGVSEHEAAAQLLAGQRDAFRHWVNATTVQETYFFRHPEQFALLSRWGSAALARGEPYRTAWSLACATGEEAFSMGATLLPFSPNLQVVGTDLSEAALRVAREARYGARSFRDQGKSFSQMNGWMRDDGFWRPSNELRSRVCFRTFNLASERLHPPAPLPPEVDVIFCRNVFIYLTPALCESILSQLASCVRPGGLLMLSPVESPTHAPAGFDMVEEAGTFAYRRHSARPVRSSFVPAVALAPKAPEPSLLERARSLANQGQLDQAMKLLTLTEDPEGLYLAASIHSERGAPEQARKLLLQLLTLRPDSIPAYFQLILLALGKGDLASALAYRQVLDGLLQGRPDEEIAGAQGLSVAYVRQVLERVQRQGGSSS